MLGAYVLTTLLPLVTAAPRDNTPSYLMGFLKKHNELRAKHGGGPLKYDMQLQTHAEKWAKECDIEHDPNTDDGQNIHATNADAPGHAGDYYTKGLLSWYAEGQNYAQVGAYEHPNNAKVKKTGHFTQVIWKASSKVGCATHNCSSIKNARKVTKGMVVVCNYQEPGNVDGEYLKNLSPPK